MNNGAKTPLSNLSIHLLSSYCVLQHWVIMFTLHGPITNTTGSYKYSFHNTGLNVNCPGMIRAHCVELFLISSIWPSILCYCCCCCYYCCFFYAQGQHPSSSRVHLDLPLQLVFLLSEVLYRSTLY